MSSPALTTAIQEALLAIVCYDDSPGGSKACLALIPPDQYDVYYRDIARKAAEYVDRYDKPPGEHTLDLVESLCQQKPDLEDVYRALFQSLELVKHEINRAYVYAEARVFARHQRLKGGIGKAIDAIQEGGEQGVAEAEAILAASLEQSYELFDPGTFLHDPDRALRFLDQQEASFPTGIPEFDRLGLGPGRKRLHLFAGGPGTGKSWWLVNLAKQAFLRRYKVLYVTLELSEQDVTQRIFQALFSLRKRDEKVRRMKFTRDEKGHYLDMKSVGVKGRPNLSQPDIKDVLRNKATRLRMRPGIVVKEFPTGALTVRELVGYLDSLEGSQGFIPDLVLIDYADLMAVDAHAYRHSLGQVYKDIRGLAMRRNLAIATASQLNRPSRSHKVATGTDIAEDYSKIATVDVFVTFNQTPAEHEKGLARLFLDKGRTDRDKFAVLVSQAYGVGQFVMDTIGVVAAYWRDIEGIDEQAPS